MAGDDDSPRSRSRSLGERLREPWAAGSTPGLEHCEKTADGYVCRWARARMSPARMVQLGRDLQSVVGGSKPEVTVRWGLSLSRSYRLKELADLPLESLRKAHEITFSAGEPGDGPRAVVCVDATREPALTATVRGPADLAQKVKDAVELGNWNPVSGNKVVALAVVLVIYGSVAAGVLFVPEEPGRALVIVGSTVGALAVGLLCKRLWPPVEITAVERTTVGTALRNAVPIIAGVVGVVATVLKIFGVEA